MRNVTLDSVLVMAKAGLTQEDFINQMLKDTLFYEAFRNMRKYSFIAENNISTFDKKGKKVAKMFRKVYHNNDGPTYKAEILSSKDSGEVYDRKGEYDLFTVKMFSYVFMNENNSDFTEAEENRKQEGYKDKLKTLIFTPGKPVEGIPLISNKTEIFSPKARKLYNYNYYHGFLQDSIPVYRFKCTMKPEIRKGKQDEVMIKDMTTAFDKYNLTILARYINMGYQSSLFDFDVQMYIELTRIGEDLVPVKIEYNGMWDVPMHEQERCHFSIVHRNYVKRR